MPAGSGPDHAGMKPALQPARDLERIWCPPAITPERRRRWLPAAEAVTAIALAADDLHPAAREAAAFAIQLPACIDEAHPGDRLAGRWAQVPVGISPEPGGFGWYADQHRLADLAAAAEVAGAADEARRWRCLAEAWQRRTTVERIRAARPAEVLAVLPAGQDDYHVVAGAAFPLARLAGCQLDHGGLLAGGLPGLRARLAERRADGAIDAEALALCDAWGSVIDAYAACFTELARRAEAVGAQAQAADCRQLAVAAPGSLAQAIQLLWVWDAGAGILNHGRIDDDLAPFLEEGGEVEAEALLAEWWRLIAGRGTVFNGRVCLGGRGRRNPQAADRLARIALRVTAAHEAIEPQVSLRLDDGQDPALLDAAFDSLARGRTFPILYWDGQAIPHAAAAHGIDLRSAERWLPYGCGETVIAGAGTASPNGIANAARILEEVLFGLPAGCRRAPEASDLDSAPAYADVEAVWSAFAARADQAMQALARWQAHSHAAAAAECRFLALSLLTDDCLARGRAILGGGVRHHGGTMELYGLADAGDSFAALASVVFAPGGCGLDTLRRAMLDGFAGHEALRGRLLHAPAYGNDDERADRWIRRIHQSICANCRTHGAAAGLDHFLVVVINNWVNTAMGRNTGALPSGRRAGTALANANNPQPGRDRQGPVALLRSLAGLGQGCDAGCVQHLKLSRSWFAGDRGPLRALLGGYAAVGGMQVMITASDPGELQAALADPAAHGHLMVRVGGFSARFVDLPRDCQEEICARSLH